MHPAVRARTDGIRLWRREASSGQPLTVIPAGEGAIEPFVHFDGELRVTAAVWSREDLQTTGADSDRVIVAYAPLVLEAEDGVRIEPSGPGSVGRLGVRGRAREARVVAREEAGEERVRALPIRNPRQAQFGDEAVLEGTEAILNAAFGLGAVGRNPADADFGECAAHLRAQRLAGELLGERRGCALVAMKDAMPVAVGRERQAVSTGHGFEEAEVAVSVLRVAKLASDHRPGGIIHPGEERQPGTAPFQPVVCAAIDLQQHPRARHALAATAMAARPAAFGTLESGPVQDPAQRGVGDVEAFALGQELLEVQMVHLRVGGLRERGDGIAQRVIETARGATPSVPMDQRGRAADPVGDTQATNLAGGTTEQARGLGDGDLSPFEGVQNHQLLVSALRQGDHASPIRPGAGRTFSLAN